MTPYAHHIAVIRRLLRAGAVARAEKVLDKIPPSDLGSVIGQLPEIEARPLCQLLLSRGRRKRTLRSIPRDGWGAVAAPLTDAELLAVVDDLSSLKAAEFLSSLPAERAKRLEAAHPMGASPHADAATVMGEPGVAMPTHTTAQGAIDVIRAHRGASQLFYLYAVDSAERLVGVVPLRRLVTAAADTPLSSLLTPNPVSVASDSSAEEAARLLKAHGFLALPVVDARGHLVGVINTDDVFELMTEVMAEPPPEASEAAPAREADPPRGSAWSQWFPFLNPRRTSTRSSGKTALVAVAVVIASGSILGVL